jgi:hypothetical protein
LYKDYRLTTTKQNYGSYVSHSSYITLNTIPITEQEFREIFELLDEHGLCPELYDTPVPFYDGRVPCGTPNELGDMVPDGYMMLPHGLPGVESVFGISVSGESMIGQCSLKVLSYDGQLL